MLQKVNKRNSKFKHRIKWLKMLIKFQYEISLFTNEVFISHPWHQHELLTYHRSKEAISKKRSRITMQSLESIHTRQAPYE